MNFALPFTFGLRALKAPLVLALFLVLSAAEGLFSQTAPETPGASTLSLRRVSLFSSGVAYFEHSGTVSGPVELKLPFAIDAVNDALKSLTISVSGGGAAGTEAPSVRYLQADVLFRSPEDPKIDLSGNPGIAGILADLRGAEIEAAAPNPIRGRILSVETRRERRPDREPPGEAETLLSLHTEGGIRLIALRDISSFSFTDPRLNESITRALDLIGSARDSTSRELLVSLPGGAERSVSLSYVIPSPVWKVSYRLDLSGKEPFLQGWAIADNIGDTDWRNVELSLLTGRPVSFIQNLYPPYNQARPVVPLAIAGIAEGRTWDSGWGLARQAAADMESAEPAYEVPAPVSPRFLAEKSAAGGAATASRPSAGNMLRGAAAEGARAEPAGDQFEFTFRQPVSLRRGESVMLPLFEGAITAEKSLVFSGSDGGGLRHPAISAELVNTTGMKLPAGPITVYDAGVYAGDALLAFLPEQEKRIISYGEDLSVTGSMSAGNDRISSGVRISGGVMTISRRAQYNRTYTFRNASGDAKRLILEHPITPGAALVEPASFAERTDRVYRFVETLPADRELTITVREESPMEEGIVLSRLGPEALAAYVSNQEIPPRVRDALRQAADLKAKAADAEEREQELEARRTRLLADQDRIRRNLEAAGNQSPQGQEYLKRLVSLDAEIDALSVERDAAAKNTREARQAYENCLASLDL